MADNEEYGIVAMINKDLTGTMKMRAIRRDKLVQLYRLPSISRLFVPFLLLAVMASFAHAAGEQDHLHDHNAVVESGQMQITNTYCPVMPDMQTSPEIFTDYKGKRVYFCCVNCRAAFGRNPEQYIGRLPQFGGTLAQADIDHHRHEHEFALGNLIKPMGITTLSLLVLTVLSGLFRRKRPKLLLKWHKRLAIITLVSALIHATLVLIAH